MSKAIAVDNLYQHLPEQIWYLSGDGTDIYCRRPYSFLFSSGTAATAFAAAFDVKDLKVVGFDREAVNVQDFIGVFGENQVTRLFIDPSIDGDTGEVFGTILRFQEPN